MAERKKPAARRGAAATGKGKAKPKAKTKTQLSAAAKRREAAIRKEQRRRDSEMALAKDGLTKDPEAKGAAKTLENAELYKAVFVDWSRGLSYDQLVEEHGLSIRRCQQIVQELRDARINVLGLSDPMFGLRQAHSIVLHWITAISDYAKLAKSASQDSVKLGAMRDRDRALEQFTGVLQELGVLPKHLGTLRVQEDFIGVMETLLDKMDELEIPHDVQRQLVEAVELRVVKRREGKLALATGGGDVIDADSVVAA